MNIAINEEASVRFARCVAASKRVNWDIKKDVFRGRTLDADQAFLPDGLSKVSEMTFLNADEQRFLSQIQGRTYANIFGLAERFVNAKMMELSQDYCFTDQVALEALVRFSEEELKHQELFRQVEHMTADVMPAGYSFAQDPNDVARAVLSKSTWAVLVLTLDIELFTQSHYLESIEPNEDLSPLYKDVFLYHWKEESQHAVIDELELLRHDDGLTDEERDQGVTDFIELVGAVDGILQGQAAADAKYFATACGREVLVDELAAIERGVLAAYRWQFIFSGAQHPHFANVLGSLITPEQGERIQSALATLR